jgi:hypothetical protein
MGGVSAPDAPAALPPGDAKPPLGEAPASAPKSAPPDTSAPPESSRPAPVAPLIIPEKSIPIAPPVAAPEPSAEAAAESVSQGLEKVAGDVGGDLEERAATDAVVTTAAVATAGYVLLNTRAVYWFISALLARPAVWRRFDPIDVIYSWEQRDGLGSAPGPAPEDDSLQSMVS